MIHDWRIQFFIFFALLLISRVNSQSLISNIISVSSNQPCISVGASLSNNSQQFFQCSTSTIMELSLSPTDAGQTSSSTYTFRALPSSTGTYNQNFFDPTQNPLSPDNPINLCRSDPTSTKCQSAISNADLFQVTISISPIPARYQLTQTGLIFPLAYYFDSRPYAINSWIPLDTCGIDPNSDLVSISSDGNNNYAKLANTVAIPKQNLTNPPGPYPNNIPATQVYADVLLSDYVLHVPGDNSLPPMQCSAQPPTGCTWGITSIGPGGETAVSQLLGTYPVFDAIFNRFLNGTLGAGGAFSRDHLPAGCTNGFSNSQCICTTPIGTTNNQYTVNVCPGNPLPNFQARQSSNLGGNAIYPAYCVNGPCGGNDEAFCALVAGFKSGFSRCLMSRDSALTYMRNGIKNMVNWPTNSQGGHPNMSPSMLCEQFITTPFFGDPTNPGSGYNNDVRPTLGPCTPADIPKSAWLSSTCMGDLYACVMYTYLFNLQENPNPSTLIGSFENATDAVVCGSYLASITRSPSVSFGDNINVDATIPYPFVLHFTDFCFTNVVQNKPCSTFFIRGNELAQQQYWAVPGNSPMSANQINDVRQLVVPFQDYTSLLNTQVGMSLANELVSNGVSTAWASDPMLTTSNSECTGVNGWQDTVIPIGPLCVAYSVLNPPTPLYEINITIQDNLGNPPCTVTIGTAAGSNKTEIISGACNNTIAAWLINADMPRGNTLPILDGYFIICGTFKDDGSGSGPLTPTSFFGGGDPSGLKNPWLNLGITMANRMPLPSTFSQMFGQECTTDANGNCAWWYYASRSELNQFGVNCNQNGFMCYGAFSPDATNTMCANGLGTCIPGYDPRQYNALNCNTNSTDPNFGFPNLCPTTKTPLFVSRDFVDFELDNTGNTASTSTPVNLPPGWTPLNPQWWIDGTFVYTDGSGTGPAYGPGDLFIRTKIAVAGELIASTTSFAPGKLRYSNNPQITMQPAGTCALFIISGGGTLQTFVQNTGVVAGTYTINGNCTNGASVQSAFSFSVDTGVIAQVQLALGFTFINGDQPICTITLSPAFTDYIFDSLPYRCVMYNSSNGAPGSIVYSTTEINNQSINDSGGYGSTGYQGNAQCIGGNPPWWCLGFKSIGNLMSWVWTIIIAMVIVVGFITLTCIIYGKTTSLEQDTQLENAAIRGRLRTAITEKMQEEKSTEKLAVLQRHLNMLQQEEAYARTMHAGSVATPSSSS